MLAPEVIRKDSSCAQSPGSKVVIFTAYPEHAALDAALDAGAAAVVIKDVERSDLVDGIAACTMESGSSAPIRRLHRDG